ncbi:MAG: phosphatidylglycerophosphatase A [Phycisphaerales bacterium JB037]
MTAAPFHDHLRKPRWLLGTVFGLGRMRPASGTWGSMPPVALAGILIFAGLGPLESPWLYHLILGMVFVIFSLACVLQGDAMQRILGRNDPGEMVADEVAGQCIALIALPIGWHDPWRALGMLAAAFFAFRLFDIFKPPPAAQLERLPGGWGILLDDLAAGFYALLAVQILGAII